MPKIVLGDNPFFSISHLSPKKSEEYLLSEEPRKNSTNIIQRSQSIGIDLFMVSSHRETPDLLADAGYGRGYSLPRICLVVPNVHEVNKSAAGGGLTGALTDLLKQGWTRGFNPRRMYQSSVMANTVFPEIEYVALHNVIVDMLLGLKASWLLNAFCSVTRWIGYKPVLITLNPIALIKARVRCEAICCYHNVREYNVCRPSSEVLKEFEAAGKIEEIWAMGILASGAVSYQELEDDELLQKFDRVLVASSKFERIKTMTEVVNRAQVHGF